MVRETRHLWVGNLPENIREDRIRDHFKRYGRVQSVKLLPRGSGRGNGNSGGNDNTSSTAGSGGSSAGVGGGGKDEDSGGGTNNTGTGANSGNGTTNNNCQGLCATVSFMDIKSAAKAHHSEQKLDDRTLTTEYHEPAAIPGATSQLYSSSSSSSQQSARFSTSHGSSEEVGGTGFDRSSHFYDRSDGSSGGAGVASGGASGGGASTNASGGYLRRTTGGTTSGTTSAGGYHPSSDVIPPPSSRSRTRERLYRNGPYPPLIDRDSKQRLGEPRKAEGEDLRHSRLYCYRGVLNSSGRSQASNSSHHRVSSSSWAYDCPSPRYSTNQLPSSTPELPYTDERRENTPVVHKKHSKSSISRRSGSDSGSNSGSSRSRSSSASSQSGSSTCSTASSSPAPSDKSCSTHSQQSAALRTGGAPQSSVSTTHTNSGSPAVHSEDRRPLAICVRNLPARSSDTSLKDGLYHEYKKHGKVTWVKVVGQGVDRYALVCFKKPDDVDKALQVSHDKLFFGCKIEVAPYQGYDVDDNEFRPFEAEQDEFHPKATRTLFIGNLEKDTTAQEIRKHFEQFGEIIDIDVKKQGTSSTYAFCQFSDISSVVRAMRTLDGEHVGQNRIKLGFGKSMHTNSVWVDGVADTVSEKYLSQQFGQFGPASHVVIDRSRGHALVFYEQIAYAQQAVKEMRGVVLRGRKLQVDYASRECQEAFYDRMDKQTNSVTSSSSSFDNSVQTTTTSSITNLRVFDTASNANTSASNASNNRYSSNSGANTVTSSSASCSITGPGNNRYSGNIGNRTTSAFVRSNSSTGNSPAAGAAQPTVSSINQAALRSTSRPQVNSSSTAQRFDYSTDYVQDRRNYRSYEDGTNTEDPGGGTTGNTSEVRHLQKERISGMLESGGTSPAAVVSSANSITVQEEGRRRCNKHRRSESNSGSTASSNVGADTGSGAPSRPGTPLCDERPENLPVEPRRTPRDRSLDPLSLPLPRFAAQVLSPRGQPVRTSPPASPFSSSDSEPSPPSPEWEERLRSLDERYEKWSGSRSGLTKIDPSSLKIRHKLLEMDVHELPPSDIVKSVLAKRSVFDEDSKRLENFGDKYEPKEFIPAPRTSFLRSTSVSKSSPGLQYPFPSHPPVQPTTSVATTTAPSPSVLTSATEVKPSVTFLNCTRPQHIQPKISSPSVAVVETTRPPAPTALHDKFKTKVKTEQPVKKDIPSPVVTSTLILPSPTISTPPKPKLSFNIIRRDSTDEKSDPVRRKSRDESVTNPAENIGNGSGKRDESNENDKVRDAQVCERRKSVSAVTDKRRSSLDSKAGENVCETSKLHRESTDKKEDRRRGSSEISDHHSTQSNPIVHHKMDTKKVESLTADSQYNCVDIHEKTTRKAPNENLEKRRETVEHSVVRHNSTEVQDKKKEISERDRRRARESTDSSHDNHSSKYNRKVPENKKETELSSATSEKRDDTVNKQNAGEPLSDKKRETLETNQTTIKHREKKEHHTQDKEKRRDSSEQTEGKTKIDRISPDCSEFPRHREQKRTNSDQNTKRDHELLKKEHDVEQKIVKKEQEDSSRLMDEPLRKEADIPVIKHKDSDRRRNSDIEISKEHSLFKKVFGFAESLRLHKERRDSDATSVKTEESGKHRREHSTDKEKRKENSSEEGAKHKAVRRSPDNQDSSRHKEDKKRHLDANNRKIKKENENSDDSKLKDITSEHSEIFHSKSREDKKKEERRDNAASKSLYYNANDGCEQNIKCNRETEKKKDFSSSLIDSKKLDDTDPTEVSKKEIDTKKEADGYYERRKDIHSDVARNRDNERRKSIDKYYENEKYREAERKKDDHDSSNYKDIEKKNDSSVEKFKHVERHRDTERKRDENLENCKTKEGERKRDFDSHERHKSSDKRKDFDGHRLKEEKKSEDGFDASKHKENERKNEEASYDRIKLKDDSYNRFKDYIRKKESDNFGERKKDGEKERRKEREHQDMQPLKECSEERKRENEKDKKRGKDYDMHEPKVNGDHDGGMFTLEDCRKSCITYDENDHRVDSLKKDKRRERNWPATIGCKRRLSSQDSLDISDDQAKRSKPERRDSKDSGRSSGSSRKGSGEKHSSKGFKLLEEKIKEDKEREQRKKEEAQDNSISSIQAEEKIIKPAIRKEKRNSGDKRKEERVAKFKSRPRENGTASESDLGSGDDDAKSAAKRQQHSIFDIVDDEPAYISMYDKVKARSTKNMQKQEEEKRQEKLKEKFHQLKASRAKREEKKRSTSYDEDSDSEKGSCRRNKLLLTSSEEDGGSESDMRMRARKILYDTSEDDTVQTPRARKMYMEHSSENKCNRKIVSDVSEDDTVIKHSTPKIKSSRNISFETDTKSRKIMSDTSEDDAARHNPTTLKLNPSRIQSDESETDLGFEDSVRTEPTSTKDFETAVCDIFNNRTVEVNHFKPSNEHQEQGQQNSSPESMRRNSLDSTASEQPRKKSHKKKQKRQKTFEENEDVSIKKHSSKKEKKKSHRDNDGDEEKKSRKKRSEREGNNKIDEKFEDIFGSLSDDSEKTMAKWQVSQVYDTDSESERENIRKKEKKRREKKLRELDEAGRAIEAKLMESTVTITEEPTKIKKKKRKKSRDEKIKHHQQRVEQEEAVVSILPKEETDQKCNIKMEPDLELVKIEQVEVKEECRSDLPHLGKLEIKIEADSENETKASLRNQSISSLLDSPPPTAPPILSKKSDIPGFGSEVDESIHETAVKSISESPRTTLDDSDIKFDDKIKSEEPPPTTNEEKPTPVISQEETEDAVAALLVDAFGGGFEGYSEDTPKPDTPVSEPDLQIDTDTEDTFDTIDFSKPPRTPDIPASYYTRQQNDTREGLEERIMSLACSAESPLKDNKPLPMPRTPDVVFDKKPATPDIDMSSSDSEKYPDKQSVVKNLSDISHLSPSHEESTVKESNKQQSSSDNKVPELLDQTPSVCNKTESTNSQQKSLVAEPPKITSASNVAKIEDLKKEPEVPKLALLIPQNISSIQTSVPQHNTDIPSLSPITKSSECSSVSQASSAQNCQKLERIQQLMPKPQTTVLVQQPQPQAAQVVKPLSVQVINSSVSKSSEQPLGLQIPPITVHAPKMSSPKQIVHKPPQTQGNLVQAASKQSNVVQNKPPSSKTIIIQQSPQQVGTGLAQAKTSSQLNNVQLKPQPAQHNMPAQHATAAQHNMPAQHATAAQHALLKSTVHRLPAPYPPMKSNQNVINAHPHLVQPSTTHLIPIKVNTTQQPQPPIQNTQPIAVPISAKAAMPPLLPTIKDSQSLQQSTPSNNSQKQLHIHVNQQGQHSPHSPQPVMSPQNLKLARPVSTTQPPPLQSISVHHFRTAPHIQQAPPRSPNPTNVPLLQTVNVSGEHTKSSQGYLPKQIAVPLPIVNCHNLMHSPNNQAPHPEKVIALSPSNPFQQQQQPHSPVPFTQKTSAAVNVIKSSSLVSEPTKVTPLQENSLDTNSKEEKNKLASNQSSNQLVQINSLENTEAVVEQNAPVKKTNDESKKPLDTDDSKPLNAVIQDLTLRAASKAMWKQQSSGLNNETNRQETAKPIEQVVLALHKKATAVPPPTHIEPTESEKKDSSLNPEESSSEIPKLDESSLSEGKTSKHETSNESIISDPQTPKPNTSLDTVSSDSKDQSATSPCERNVPSHTPSPASTTNMFQEKNQKDQNTLEAHKIESQINEPVNNNATENNSLSSSNVSQDKKQSVQIARKSPTPMAEKRSDRKTPPDCSPKVDDGPEAKTPRTSKETPDIQSQADEKAKPDILAPTTPVTTRPNARGGRRRKGSGVGGRGGGGVATRRTRLANSSAPSPISTDVYEFRDDPEEERPRLILTIKSPPEPAASSAVVHTTSVHHESSSASISASTPTTTRKSRRLQEKDGSRTTIDETIDDVVRGNRPGRRTTRSSAHSLSLPSSLQPEATRKSPRRRQQASQQQQQQQQQQQSQLQQSQQPTRQPSPAPSQESSPPAATLQTTTCTSNVVTSLPAPQTPIASGKQTMHQQQVSQASISTMEVNSNNSSPEPTTLIDPVTGLLIPMTESEEGQYVPLHSETNRSSSSVAPSTTTREDGEPAEKRARLSVQPPPVTTTLPQQAASTGQPPPQLPVSQQQPLQQQNSSPVQERAHPSMAVSVVPSPTISTSRSEESVGRTTTAITTAAVTLTACAPPITPSRPSVVRPIASSHSVVAPHGMLLPQGKVVSTQVSSSVVRPSLPITSLSHNTPPPLVASIASTSVNQTRMSSNIPSSTSITAVTGTSISAAVPKAHLLQAANVRPSPPPPLPPVLAPPHGPPIGMPTPVAPKAHLLQVVGSSGTREGVVGSSAPHQGTVLTGSVASPPPLRAHQQPVVTGASSARVLVKEPPPQSSRMLIKDDRAISGPPASARLLIKEDQRNAMPSVGGSSVPSPRVLVKESGPQSAGCIVGIAGSPQPPPPPPPRGQVMQAGMPVPAYEASLHGVVAELLPNPQWPRQSPPPAHQHSQPQQQQQQSQQQQQQGDVVQHVSYGPHHIQPAHYVHPQLMYQQYLREAALGGPYNRPLGGVVKTDLDDRPGSATAAASALVASPPLELRRGSPHDRTTDSPQVATVYMHHNPASRHHVYYDGPPPPPAHRPQPPPSQSTAGRLQTPPHAGQAPPQADSLLMLLQRYPVMWQGLLALKNDQAAVQMHFVFGNHHLAQDSLPHNSDGSTPPLRIAQRMRLEQTQVEGVARKMQIDNEHCMLLALPCGRDHMDVLQQSTNLQNGFITYLQQKQAAGIINIAAPGSQQAAYVVHIFPACEFANESLARIAPDLLHRVADLAHLLIVIATV